MTKQREKTIHKYGAFVDDMFHKTNGEGRVIKIVEFTKLHGVSASLPTIMLEKGLIKKTHQGNHQYLYQWDTINPTKAMVLELIKSSNQKAHESLMKKTKVSKKRSFKFSFTGRLGITIHIFSLSLFLGITSDKA